MIHDRDYCRLTFCTVIISSILLISFSFFLAQGLSRAATDALVINATKKPTPADKPPPGYSSVGSNWDKYEPLALQSMLLTAVIISLKTPEEWHYLGRHALPICLPTFVAAANRLMFDSKPEGLSHEEVAPGGNFTGVCFMLLRKSLLRPPLTFKCHPRSSLNGPTSTHAPHTPPTSFAPAKLAAD